MICFLHVSKDQSRRRARCEALGKQKQKAKKFAKHYIVMPRPAWALVGNTVSREEETVPAHQEFLTRKNMSV